MKLVRTIAEVRACRDNQDHANSSFGLVPTMGALHAGHLALVNAARLANEHVAVSIFVNPTQFGPNEDLDKYPRTFEADCSLLRDAGVDLLFAPEPGAMYPQGFSTSIDIGPLAARLDGASRPGHFQGVATVVAKLFHIFTPTRAYFGQKDAAQVAVIRKLVRDLVFPVEVVVCSTVREQDGLALSSRNRYLTTKQRTQASVLNRALHAAKASFDQGERRPVVLLSTARTILDQEPAFRLDYLDLVDPDTLLPILSPSASEGEPAQNPSGDTELLALAGWLGDTRLIDNLLLTPEPVSAQTPRSHELVQAQ